MINNNKTINGDINDTNNHKNDTHTTIQNNYVIKSMTTMNNENNSNNNKI